MTATAIETTLKSFRIYGDISFEAPKVRAAMEDGPEVEDSGVKPKSAARWLNIKAYNGGPLQVGWGYPCVIDLAFLQLKRGRYPAFLKHDPEKIVGFAAETMNDGRSLDIKAKCVSTEWARHVTELADEEYPWQASIGVDPIKAAFIDEGESLMVNGRQIAGPFYHIQGTLREISIVPLGADSDTDVIAAELSKPPEPQKTAKESFVTQEEIKKIQAEFADDPAFALESVAQGRTLIEAKAAYVDVLRKREADAKAKLAAEQSKAKPPTTVEPIRAQTSSQGSNDGGNPADVFQQRVAQLVASGQSKRMAVANVARSHPDLHKQMLTASNPRKSLPAYYA